MRNRRRSINPHAHSQRGTLRLLGMLLLVPGVVLSAIGLISFFSAFGGSGNPDKFWCAFLGLPMVASGLGLLKFGYMGAVTRYMAGEVAPVARDTLNEVAHGTRSGVRAFTSAVREGLSAQPDEQATRRCSACQADNDPDASFCDQCGQLMERDRTCSACAEPLESDARFCHQCGARAS